MSKEISSDVSNVIHLSFYRTDHKVHNLKNQLRLRHSALFRQIEDIQRDMQIISGAVCAIDSTAGELEKIIERMEAKYWYE